jgi:RNA polymerase sigma factor (sigma-70 family)
MHPPLTRIVDRLRRLSARPGDDADETLLNRFASLGDEDAFAAIMARHGPMVFNVCYRVLGDRHTAEDAFQATFLVLARKAGRLRRPGRLPAWLYGVAHRTALKARDTTARRLAWITPTEAPEPLDPGPDPLAALTARDLVRALEEEIQRLPGSYRLPVVLCCLEGLSQEEAARRLECTVGSVKGRLERGRAKLHARLVQRGLTLATTLAVVEASRGTARARFSPTLTGSTARAATRFRLDANTCPAGISSESIKLAHTGLQTMYPSNLKIALALVVVVGVAGTGFGWRKAGMAEPGPLAAAQPDAIARTATDEKPRDQQAAALENARNQLNCTFRDLMHSTDEFQCGP